MQLQFLFEKKFSFNVVFSRITDSEVISQSSYIVCVTMNALEQFRKVLNIPTWFRLTLEEYATLNSYLSDANDDVSQAFWALRLDCSACCNGCVFCDSSMLIPVCNAKGCNIERKD